MSKIKTARDMRWNVIDAWDDFLMKLSDNDSLDEDEHKIYLSIIRSELGTDILDAYTEYLEENE